MPYKKDAMLIWVKEYSLEKFREKTLIRSYANIYIYDVIDTRADNNHKAYI